MDTNYKLLLLFMVILTIGIPVPTWSQDTIRQEVEVVKSYTPASIDAEKINENPVIKDEAYKKPDFSYSIFSSPVFSTLSVKDLQAATVIGKPADNPGFGLVRAGFGNYNKPYGELFFNNKETKNSVFGLHLRHLSSHGKLNLTGGDRVKAPFSDSEAEMFMKYMFRRSTLSMNLGVDHKGFRYYGYPGDESGDSIPAFLKDPLQELTFQGNKQAFTRGGIQITLQNIMTSRLDPATGFTFQYYRFGNKTGQKEHFSNFTMDFHRPAHTLVYDVKAGAEYSDVSEVQPGTSIRPESRKQMWLFFKPSARFGNQTINLTGGFKAWFVFGQYDGKIFKIVPDIRFNFVPVKEIISVFAGIDGNYHHNHYSAVAYENPYITPMLSVDNHFEKLRIYGGFDGKIAAKTNFKIQADHSEFTGFPFYYLKGFQLPTMGPLPGPTFADNTFHVLYDDLKTLKFNGEVTHHAGDKLNLLVSVNLYKHTPANQEKAWNLPSFDGTLSLEYKITERLGVAADFYVIGKRDALLHQLHAAPDSISLLSSMSSHQYILDTAVDLNLRGSYEISGKLAVFCQMNNFGFQKYERWLGYPVQSFNLLGGISYSF